MILIICLPADLPRDPRARVTLLLSHYYEAQANETASVEKRKEHLIKASEILSELQVETYSSMDRKEKTEFLLEQMRLLVAVARTKDAEGKELREKGGEGEGDKVVTSDGDTEWIKVRVGGRRVPEAFLAEEGNEVRSSSVLISFFFCLIFLAGLVI